MTATLWSNANTIYVYACERERASEIRYLSFCANTMFVWNWVCLLCDMMMRASSVPGMCAHFFLISFRLSAFEALIASYSCVQHKKAFAVLSQGHLLGLSTVENKWIRYLKSCVMRLVMLCILTEFSHHSMNSHAIGKKFMGGLWLWTAL